MLPKPYYQDDAVTLYNADARQIVPFVSGVVVSDPPYNIGYHYGSYKDDLDRADYLCLMRETLRTPSVVIHYAEDIFDIAGMLQVRPQKLVAWVYPSNTQRQWRAVAWFGVKPDFDKDSQDYRNPEDKRIAERILNGERARLYDWWEINQVKNVGEEKTEHPCQIPLAVMSRILKITEADCYIDPFAGSGTTLRAAKDLGRKAIGVEIDERYCEIVARRLQQEVLHL